MKLETIKQSPDTEHEICIWTFILPIYCLLEPHQKWSLCKVGCNEDMLKEEKRLIYVKLHKLNKNQWREV